MSALPIPELWHVLEGFSQKCGAGPTRATCQRWLMKKTLAGEIPTPRKPIPRRWVEKAFIHQRGNCARCGKPMMLPEATGDHRKALAQGGKHAANNTDALHSRCNSAKGARTLSEDAKFTGNTVKEYLERTGQ